MMDTKQLTAAAAKHVNMSDQEAQQAVAAVLASLQNSRHAPMVFRKTETRDLRAEAGRQIFLCG